MKAFIHICLWMCLGAPTFVTSQSHSLRLSKSSVERGDEETFFEIVKTDRHSQKRRGTVKGSNSTVDRSRNLKKSKKKKGKCKKGKKGSKGKKSKNDSSDEDCFDVGQCSTYGRRWLFDLEASCRGDPLENNFEGCECRSAQERINNGEIDCLAKPCPDDCEVCKTCLIYVIPECYKANPPRGTGARLPRAPTPKPSPSPTELDLFDIDKCSTYSADWIMDLKNSCDNNVFLSNYDGCKCPDAQRRINNGQIDCRAKDICPRGCPVCEICMYFVVDDCINFNPARNLGQ